MNPKLKRSLAVVGVVAVFAVVGLVMSHGQPHTASPALEKCLTLEHWSWAPSANGELVDVSADVRAGDRDDACAQRRGPA